VKGNYKPVSGVLSLIKRHRSIVTAADDEPCERVICETAQVVIGYDGEHISNTRMHVTAA